MQWNYKIATIKGIDLKVNITFVFILLWSAFQWQSETQSALQSAIFGIVATLLLFVCVTLHEFGHAFQAKAYGIDTIDVTLLPIGGVARLSRIPEEPRQEFRIAIAGPLVNLAIAAVLSVVAVIAIPGVIQDPLKLFDDLDTGRWESLLSYILFANLWLILFNLIPAFPMDGGRVLRSLLAMRMGRLKATSIAVTVGRILAVGMAALGLYSGQYALLLIAMFIWFAGGQEKAMLTAAANPSAGISVATAMNRNTVAVSLRDSLNAAIVTASRSPVPAVPVLGPNGKLFGMTGLSQLLDARARLPEGTVADALLARPVQLAPEDSLSLVTPELIQSGGGAVMVVDGTGSLVGVITQLDLVAFYRKLMSSRLHRVKAA